MATLVTGRLTGQHMRRLTRKLVGAVVLGLACTACAEPRPQASSTNEAVARGCAFLWSKQAADGGWHSEDYGLLRSGQSLTGLVLSVLLDVPESVASREQRHVRRAFRFLARQVDEGGALRRGEALVPDYPNYGLGLMLRVFADHGSTTAEATAHAAVAVKVRSHLLAEQFAVANGWRKTDPAFGGWGMGDRKRPGPRNEATIGPGHVDLSMTRVVAQGLACGQDLPATAAADLSTFLSRCRGDAGGFCFSPVVLGANKAGKRDDLFTSYGSTTADGVLALLATGARPDDPRVEAARDWLIPRHRLDRVPGIPNEVPARWAEGLRFYYLRVVAEVFDRLEVEAAPAGSDWREALQQALRRDQREDGSWANPVAQVKEDDPLIATSLALRALLHAAGIRAK